MTLRILLADRVLFDGRVVKVVVDAVDGSRGFLPRHADFTTVLKPGVLTCTDGDGEETFFAVNGGVLVKKGPELTVATREAVKANRLDDLPDELLSAFAEADEHARTADTAVARLETALMREFLELQR